MTFDFAPEWVEALRRRGPTCASMPAARQPSLAAVSAAACSDPAQLAALVGELFAEGTLSWDQLRSLMLLPEMEKHLEPTLSAVPQVRRVASRK